MTIALYRRPPLPGRDGSDLAARTSTADLPEAVTAFHPAERPHALRPPSSRPAPPMARAPLPTPPPVPLRPRVVRQLRRLARLCYFVVRPVVRPAAWRLRSFLLRDSVQTLTELRVSQDATRRDLQGLAAQLQGIADLMEQGGAGVGRTPPRAQLRLRRKVHQFHAGSATGDAITNAMLLLRRRLRAMGYESEIFAENIGAGLEGELLPIDALPMQDDHVLLVHHSMGHDGFARVAASSAQKLLIYHNITPPALLAHDPHMQRAAELGLRQLAQWRQGVVAALADSVFNGMALRRLGFPCVLEATLLFDTAQLQHVARQNPPRDPAEPYTVLFVGRIVPSKGQADLVEAFAAFARRWRAASARPVRLVLAGAEQLCATGYPAELMRRVRARGLERQVVLTGKLSDADLHGWYGRADLYVSLSRHEGFGVPLVEAMAHRLPVVALAVGAVPMTLGEGAVLVDDADPETVAAAMLAIARDPARAGRVARDQAQMLEVWSLDRHLPVLQQALALAGAAPGLPAITRPMLEAALRITIAGHVNGSYSLAAVNRRLAGALDAALPGRVRLQPFEAGHSAALSAVPQAERAMLERLAAMPAMAGDAVVTISQHFPLLPPQPGEATLAMLFWEESVLPRAMVRQLNAGFAGVLAPASSVARALVDSGVTIPVRVVGFAPDLSRFRRLGETRRDRQASTITFLHVSSCFPRKGVDVLLAAWARAFRAGDDVRLVIKGFPNPHNNVAGRLAALRIDDPEMAPVSLIDTDIGDEALLALYRDADVMVLPTRGEGFNLPAAEALASGMRLIVTGHGGHMDFCSGDDANVRPLAYRMHRAASHLSEPGALWAEPDIEDLVRALREATRPAGAVRAPVALPEADAWASRVQQAAADILLSPRPVPIRLAWVTPWQVRCGVAEYSRHLLGAFPRDGMVRHDLVLCDQRAVCPTVPPLPGVRALPVFLPLDSASLAGLSRAVAAEDPDVVVIQHQPGLIAWADLASLLQGAAMGRRCVVVALHNTRDLLLAEPALRLRVATALAAISRVLVHAVADLALLQDLGVTNTALLAHGTTAGPAPRTPVALAATDSPVIGTTGFILPHKGLTRLIAAAAILRRSWPGLRLRLVTARYPDDVSHTECARCEAMVRDLGLADAVEWHTDFEPNARVLSLLSDCDLVVMPYAPTLESSSGAVRQALASGAPTLVSDLPLFDDLGDAVDRLAQASPEAIAARVATLLRQPAARAQLQANAQTWLAAHDWSLMAERLSGMLQALHAAHRREALS